MRPPRRLLAGCGASSSNSPKPQFQSLAGNWQFSVSGLSNSPPRPPIISFAGALQSSGSSVTGTLHAIGSQLPPTGCVSLHADLPATGTIDASGAISLTIPLPGGAANLTGNLSPDLQSLAQGTWQITGDCAMPSTAINIVQVAPLAATYSGTLTRVASSMPPTPAAVNVVASLTQSNTPDPDGLFLFSGTISLTGGCSQTFSFQDEALLGYSMLTQPFTGTPPGFGGSGLTPRAGALLGGVNPTATILHATLEVDGGYEFSPGTPPTGACAGLYNGVLTSP